jgi:hypothetical protein
MPCSNCSGGCKKSLCVRQQAKLTKKWEPLSDVVTFEYIKEDVQCVAH